MNSSIIPLSIIFFIWLVWWALNRSKRSTDKKREAFLAELKAERDSRSDKRPTMVEAMLDDLNELQSMWVRGDNWHLRANPIIARHTLDEDLGRYAQGPAPYELDQRTRDILLVHARKDAAEALANTRSLLEEIDNLAKSANQLHSYFFWVSMLGVLAVWWKFGVLAQWWQWLATHLSG